MTECYNCGQEGHRRSDCPQKTPLPPAAPKRAAERHLHAVPDAHIARTWADVIRKTLGWGPPEPRGLVAMNVPPPVPSDQLPDAPPPDYDG